MKSLDPHGLEPSRLWALRFYGVFLAALSWYLAILATGAGSGLQIAFGLLAVAAAVGSVIVIPIKVEWVRWLFNMIVPFPAILVALAAIVALF